jgi:transposase
MAKRYRPVDRDQPYLFPPSMRDWLPDDHPVWLVIRAVELMDTSAFHALRHAGGAGAAGYDPDMLVTVLTWAYAHQVTSSRRIGQLCRTDVAFRVICAGNTPRHVTIAEFRKAFGEAIGPFFAEVLALCARLGMGRLGVVALDGMKIAANASKSANRTEETLARLAAETVAAHAAADAADDDLFGAGVSGDEVPGDAWSPRRRDERIAAALASVRAGRQAAEAARARQARGYLAQEGRARGMPPQAAAVEAARARLERARAGRAARLAELEARAAGPLVAGSRRDRPRAGVEDYCLVEAARAALDQAQARAARAEARAAEQDKDRKETVRNITDPDARLMPVRGGGFIEGYNTQNVTSKDGLIIATELTGDTTDTAWFEPMLRAAEDAARLIAAHRPAQDAAHAGAAAAAPDPPPAGPAAAGPQPEGPRPRPAPGDRDGDRTGAIAAALIELFLADAGYLSEHNLSIAGPDRLIATGKTRDLEKAARDPGASDGVPWASPLIAAMAARLATPEGIAAYRHRGHIAETPHGHIKHNMRFRQLSVRGKPRAKAEWTFVCAVHNLFKAITTGHLTVAALDRLASQAGQGSAPQVA